MINGQNTATSEALSLGVEDRREFLKKSYAYLIFSIIAFGALSALLLKTGASGAMLSALGRFKYSWLGVLGAFALIGWLASWVAATAVSRAMQSAALAGYVFAESLFFAPLLAYCVAVQPGAIGGGIVVTGALVGGLIWTAANSKSDFSFLQGILKIGGLVALGLIVASILFGFQLGIWFSAAMIMFAGAAVLFDTAQIMKIHPVDRPIGAALRLFSSIALLFWYVLRFLIQSTASDDD